MEQSSHMPILKLSIDTVSYNAHKSLIKHLLIHRHALVCQFVQLRLIFMDKLQHLHVFLPALMGLMQIHRQDCVERHVLVDNSSLATQTYV